VLDLATTAPPVSIERVVPAPAVGAAFMGRARDLRRRVEREDGEYITTVNALIMPAQQRLRKFPQRKLRPEMLTELVQGWRYMQSRNFRTHLAAKLERTRCSISERRAVAAHMKLHEGWENEEPAIGISEITMTANGNRLHAGARMRCTFSLHALARRYQRGLDCDDAALLLDMELVAQLDADACDVGTGYKITTDEHGGGWRGRTVRVRGDDGHEQRVLSVRTWLSR
jgi:hypothetical protein